MSRKQILWIPVIVFGMLVIAAVALIGCLVGLIPVLIRPSIIERPSNKIGALVSRQMVRMMMGGGRRASQSGPTLVG